MKKFIYSFLVLMVFFMPWTVFASENNRPNNKYGMHIAVPDDNDIQRVAELVNSNGGDWGYITIVIHENDKDIGKWQGVFDKLRELHLIPIIRLATKGEGDNWRRPDVEDADEWVKFLDSLNWVVKDRYISIFNEPNHGQEWGGVVDPQNYAEVAHAFAKKFKEKNPDFFIMPAGFDVSAPASPPAHQDAAVFMKALVDYEGADKFNERFDGWASHSYPNPGFSASVYKRGRESITTYDWELNLLKSWGVKDLPVFIKETGWNGDVLSREQIAENYRIAFEEVWIPDGRVQAVTPFILNYQGKPFLKFSWVKEGNAEFNPEYYSTLGLNKPDGNPSILENGIFNLYFPQKLVEDSVYEFPVKFKNTGQGIWDKDEGYKLVIEDENTKVEEVSDLADIKPNSEGEAVVKIKTERPVSSGEAKLALYKGEEKVLGIKDWVYQIEPLPAIDINLSYLIPRKNTVNDNVDILIYDYKNKAVYKALDKKLKNNKLNLDKIRNVSYGEKYYVKLNKPYYVSEKEEVVFEKDGNNLQIENILPLDFSKDGKINYKDFIATLKNTQFISSFK